MSIFRPRTAPGDLWVMSGVPDEIFYSKSSQVGTFFQGCISSSDPPSQTGSRGEMGPSVSWHSRLSFQQQQPQGRPIQLVSSASCLLVLSKLNLPRLWPMLPGCYLQARSLQLRTPARARRTAHQPALRIVVVPGTFCPGSRTCSCF